MAKRKQKSGVKFIFLLMALVLVYFAYTISGQLVQINNLENQLSEQNENLQNIETENDNLKAEIENSDSLSFIERIARDEYGLVKPKEVIFIDRDKDNKGDWYCIWDY